MSWVSKEQPRKGTVFLRFPYEKKASVKSSLGYLSVSLTLQSFVSLKLNRQFVITGCANVLGISKLYTNFHIIVRIVLSTEQLSTRLF